MLILSICIASSLQNFLISLFFMGVLALFLIVGSNSVFLKGYMYVKQVNMALVINMFATLALMESTTLFHFFLLLEVFLALSMFFLSSEHNLSHHSFLYLIPNVVVGLIFLVGIVVTVMSMGTMHLSSLSLMSQSVPSFLFYGFVVSSLSFSLVILCKMFSFPFNLFLPQIYNNLTAPSLAFFSLAFLIPYYIITITLLSIVPISCINLLFLLSALSVVSSGTLICFSGVLSTILAHLTSLNNNMAVLLLIGLNTVDASFYFFFFLFTYLLTILPAYYQISAFNLMTSLHSFLEVSNKYNFHVHAFNLFVLLLLSGFPTAILFTGKIGLLNRFVFTTTFILFFSFYFLVTFILFLSILALSITVVEPQNQIQVDKNNSSTHGIFTELTFGFFPVCCLVSSVLLFFVSLGLFF